ncbi:MAG: hypothetical protein CMG64_01095 [Candidatus Marinimicrobia bacterium]|nr:hypothetical protein [Candidatus Neomarinimicrobiota bacterium]
MKHNYKYFIIIFSMLISQETIGPNLYNENLINFLQNNYKTNTTLSYNNARDILYSEIDIDNNNKVYCIYTNYNVTLPSNVDPSTYLYENGMNCEHIWPQSMYEGTSPMKSDMHHLRPCKENANSYRSNKPFNESQDSLTNNWLWLSYNNSNTPNTYIDEYSENGSSVFEPREDKKGDIARTIFYFYTIYSDVSDNSFFEQQKNILFNWHEQDPVEESEITRTWLIANYQNNIPNPFILDSSLIYRAYFFTGIVGDLNEDGVVNVSDIVAIINFIINGTIINNNQIANSDLNGDNVINVSDIVALVNIIIGEN